jgi:hypothetical protein
MESRIKQIKKELMGVGEMRPGSLTRQNRGLKKTGSYYQLSYTHQMKGRTEYIREEFANLVKQQIATYKKFKKMIEEWISLAIQYSKMKMDLAKQQGSG